MENQDVVYNGIPDMTVDEVRDLYDSTKGYSTDGFEPRSLRSPDTGRWEQILLSDHFADDLMLLDELFQEQGHEVETHVDRPSFRQVEYKNHPRPEPLGLMVNDYDSFTENVSHPVFHGMNEDDRVRPTDSSIEVSFGCYDDSESLNLGFQSMDVHIPTFLSFNSSVLNQAFSSLETGYGRRPEDSESHLINR